MWTRSPVLRLRPGARLHQYFGSALAAHAPRMWIRNVDGTVPEYGLSSLENMFCRIQRTAWKTHGNLSLHRGYEPHPRGGYPVGC